MENLEKDQLYTIADISRQFNLPESTCRYYCKRFAEYIPSVGEGRRKRFRKDTIGVISTIVEEMKKSRTCDAVEEILAVRYPRTALVIKNENTGMVASNTNENDNKDLSTRDNQIPEVTSNNYMLNQVFPPLMLEYMERQTKALEGIAKMFNVFISNFANLNHKDNNESLDEMKQQITQMKELLDENEKTQQADLDQLRLWINRIMKKLCHANAN